jgi:hypothetical protein
MMKKLLLALAFALVVSPSFAWKVADAPAPGDNELDLIPTASIGLGFAGTPTYGVNVDEALIFEHVIGDSKDGYTLSPYLGIDGGFYLDLAPSITSNLNSAPIVKFSLGLIGPDIGGNVPGIMCTYDFQTGERQTLATLNIPFDLFAGTVIRLN